MSVDIRFKVGDPLSVEAEGLIHPTTGDGAPEGERLEQFYERAGDSVLESVQQAQPTRIGGTIETDGGNLPFRVIVHIPIRTGPGTPTTRESIQAAFRSGLVVIDREGVQTAVCPRVIPESREDPEETMEEYADMVLRDVLQYPPQHLRTLWMVDPDRNWIETLQDRLLPVQQSLPE